MSDFHSAIDFEKLEGKPLAELSAVEFIQLLNHPKTGVALGGVIADKKKQELWIEEGNIWKIPVGILLEKLRGEKKKAELEPMPGLGRRPLERGDAYAQLAEEIAVLVEARLRGGR